MSIECACLRLFDFYKEKGSYIEIEFLCNCPFIYEFGGGELTLLETLTIKIDINLHHCRLAILFPITSATLSYLPIKKYT